MNINKQKKEAFQILRPELEEDPVDNPFFDERVGLDKKKLVRARRPSFQFVEEGKWSKQAEMQKLRVRILTAGSWHSIVITLISLLLNYSIYTHCEDLL